MREHSVWIDACVVRDITEIEVIPHRTNKQTCADASVKLRNANRSHHENSTVGTRSPVRWLSCRDSLCKPTISPSSGGIGPALRVVKK